MIFIFHFAWVSIFRKNTSSPCLRFFSFNSQFLKLGQHEWVIWSINCLGQFVLRITYISAIKYLPVNWGIFTHRRSSFSLIGIPFVFTKQRANSIKQRSAFLYLRKIPELKFDHWISSCFSIWPLSNGFLFGKEPASAKFEDL